MTFLPDFGPAYTSEILWSLAALNHRPSPEFIFAAVEVTWNKWDRVVLDSGWLSKTIWALIKMEADKKVEGHPLFAAFDAATGHTGGGEPEGGKVPRGTGGEDDKEDASSTTLLNLIR